MSPTLVARSPTIRLLFEWMLARLKEMPTDERHIGWTEVSDIEGIFSYDCSVAIRVAKQLAEAGSVNTGKGAEATLQDARRNGS
jgi:hypothetical protein